MDLFTVNELFGNALEKDELEKVSEYYHHQDGWTNRLIQGDSHLVMASLLEREGMAGQVQTIYFDPPYGIKRDERFEGIEGFGGFGKPIARKQYKGWGDEHTPQKSYFDELIRISKNQIVWGANFFTDKLPCNGHWIFWDKINTMPTFGDGELAWTSFMRKSVKQITLQYNGLLGIKEERIHATQKPVALYEWLLDRYAKKGDKILDTHGGSMSSAIACYNLGYDLDICELDKEYFTQAKKRFENHCKQVRLTDLI
jgi:site-specific DNA-methyltransferase (adenine-specific)